MWKVDFAKPGYPCFFTQTAELAIVARLRNVSYPVSVVFPFAKQMAQQPTRPALLLTYEPTEDDSLHSHRQSFSEVLQSLYDEGPIEWPAGCVSIPDSYAFMLTFGGVSFYLLALSPYHEHRTSRKSYHYLVVYFVSQCSCSDIELGTPHGDLIRSQVHERVRDWDQNPLIRRSMIGCGKDKSPTR